MRNHFFLLASFLLLTGCVYDFPSNGPAVGGLALIDFTDRSGEEYCEKMKALFAEHFSAEEMKRIASIHQDGIYIRLLSDYSDNPGAEQTRNLDRFLRSKWGEDIYERVNTGVFHGKSCQLKRSFMPPEAEKELRAKLNDPVYHSILIGIDALSLKKKTKE